MQQLPTPNAEDVKDVESILLYFVSLLIALLVIVVPFAIIQINKRFKDKDDLIALKDNLLLASSNAKAALQLKLDNEVEYSKNLGVSTTGVLKDNTSVLKTAIKALDEVGVNVSDAKSVVKENNSIVKDIKNHQQNLKN